MTSEAGKTPEETETQASSVIHLEYLVYDEVRERVVSTHFNMILSLSSEDAKKLPISQILNQLPRRKVQDRIIAQPVYALRENPTSDPMTLTVLCGHMREDESSDKLEPSSFAQLTKYQESDHRVTFSVKASYKNDSLPLQLHANVQSTVKLMQNVIGNAIQYWYDDGVCLCFRSNRVNTVFSSLWWTYLLHRLSMILKDCTFKTIFYEDATPLELTAPQTTWYDVLLERVTTYEKENEEQKEEQHDESEDMTKASQ